jgi:hypothetical protein
MIRLLLNDCAGIRRDLACIDDALCNVAFFSNASFDAVVSGGEQQTLFMYPLRCGGYG